MTQDYRRLIAANTQDEILLTDTGNGHVFVELYRDVVRYNPDERRWFLRQHHLWVPDTDDGDGAFALTQGVTRALRRDAENRFVDDTDGLNNYLRAIARCESVGNRRAMLRVASADPRIRVDIDDLDAVPYELATPSGVVDLRDGSFREPNATDMHSRFTVVDYDPDATSPLLDEFLDVFIPDAAERRYVFAVLGSALVGGNMHRMMPIFWGPSTSGKSQLFTGIHNVLGSYSAVIGSSVFRGNLDDRPRPDLVSAMGARLVWASEASRSWALHADQIKRLTGGEPLPYRNLFAGVVMRVPRFTPALVTNVFPRIVGADDPLKRRICVVHMNRFLTKAQEDPAKRDAFLRDEGCRRALLAALVAGARDSDLLKVSKWPSRFVQAQVAAVDDIDHIKDFLDWAFEDGYLERVPVQRQHTTSNSAYAKVSDVHALYNYWAHKHGDNVDKHDRLGRKQFGETLRERGWETVASAGTRWMGITLNLSLVDSMRIL